jgi:CO/xanthine dehydrogenase FAD-binding subunit
LQDFKYLKPETLEEALNYLEQYGKAARILAGGTDIIIALKDKMITCDYLIDIKGIKELKEITYSEAQGLSIGSAVCLNDIIESEPIKNNYSILVDAGKTLANKLLRNRATLTGNICNSSPGGDMLPAALVLEGSVHVASKQATRVIPLQEFFTGVKKNALKENEIVTKISFPVNKGNGTYLKKSRIKGHDLAQIGIAGYLTDSGRLSFAIGAAGPTPVLVNNFSSYKKSELFDNKTEILNKIMASVSPISDVRATKEYRLVMLTYMADKIIEGLGDN